jgi:hypothetical protein
MIRINIGCGQTPTKGWQNYDNSFNLRLAKIPILPILLGKLRVLSINSFSFVVKNQIEYDDATKGLPLQDLSVDVIYTSHMLEHLNRNEADFFSRKFVVYFDLVASLKFLSHASRNWLSNISNLRMQMPS